VYKEERKNKKKGMDWFEAINVLGKGGKERGR